MALTVVVAYDISEDRRRARVAATLQTWGNRVQKSVFVCAIEPERLDELAGRLTEMINVDTDSIYFFRQCGTCWDDVVVIGQATVEEPAYYWAIL